MADAKIEAKIESTINKDEENRALLARKRKLMFSAAIAGISFAILVGYAWRNRGSCDARGTAEPLRGMLFDKSGDVVNPPVKAPEYSPEELLQLAKDAQNAGLMVMGVTQCGWTRKQREMFGGADSEARKVFEKIYIECRNREMCPNVRGYPSWVRGDQIFPGFKDPAKIRELIKEVGPLPAQQQVRDSALPNEANIPDAKHAVPSAPLPQDTKAQDDALVAETKLLDPAAPTAKQQARLAEMEAEEEAVQEEETKTERVRGVSNYPPLNVPDMPGTAAMSIDTSHVTNQFQQGNVPRQSLQNRDLVQDLAAQMASTFQQIAYDAQRDPGTASYSNARMPQSSHITSGDALDDKRIYVEKN